MKTLRTLCLAYLTILLIACSESAIPVEEDIKLFIEQGVVAAEAADVHKLKTMISRDYEDERGYKRIIIGKLLETYFSQRKNIHILHSIKSIEIISRDYAKVVMTVAIANQNITDESLWDGINADYQRLDLELEKDGEWQVKKSTWSPALLTDFE